MNPEGLLGNIINTLYIVVGTLLFACPIGIGAAIYLNEYAKNKKFVAAVSFTTEVLSDAWTGTIDIIVNIKIVKSEANRLKIFLINILPP